MDQPKKSNRFFSKLSKTYRMVLLNETTFEQRYSFKLNPLIFLFIIGFLMVLSAALTTYAIAFTPLKKFIPGQSSLPLYHKIQKLYKEVDSLEVSLLEYQGKAQSVYKVLLEDHRNQKIDIDSVLQSNRDNINLNSLKPSQKDLALREEVAEKDKFSVFSSVDIEEAEISKTLASLLPPVKGLLVKDYETSRPEKGIKVQVKTNEKILAISDGIVLYRAWTLDMGHICVIRHLDGLISMIQGASKIHVTQGETILQGEVIGKSTPDFYFSLWLKDQFIDPSLYLSFDHKPK